jgi:hypothetical protein
MMAELNAIPTTDALEHASDLHVFDLEGTKVRFGSLFESQKTIFVFIRQ